MRLVLFDIDGTLIDSGGAGIRALNRAFAELFGVQDAFRTVGLAGRTDLQIIKEGLRLHGIATDNGVIPEFCERYVEHLRSGISETEGHVKPGIREALDALSREEGIALGLLTGNIELGASIKLGHFGLDAYFPVGAFGNEHEDRNRLLPIAVGKFTRNRSAALAYRDCVIIGDTPRDVECARPYGAFTIAVATGPYSAEELAESGPDALFEDFSDTSGLLSLLRRG